MSYGYCPICNAPGVNRERRPDGNDTCKNGHKYPTRDATYKLVKIAELSKNPDDDGRFYELEQPPATGNEKTAAQVIAELTAERYGLREQITAAAMDMQSLMLQVISLAAERDKALSDLQASREAVRVLAEGYDAMHNDQPNHRKTRARINANSVAWTAVQAAAVKRAGEGKA